MLAFSIQRSPAGDASSVHAPGSELLHKREAAAQDIFRQCVRSGWECAPFKNLDRAILNRASDGNRCLGTAKVQR